MTNGDKIRQRYANASDVELYHFETDNFDGRKCPPNIGDNDNCPQDWDEITWDDCEACWVRWLGEEADGEPAAYMRVSEESGRWHIDCRGTLDEVREALCDMLAKAVRQSNMTNAEAGEYLAEVIGEASAEVSKALKERG